LFFLCLVISFEVVPQSDQSGISVMFYNVENLFDVRDDPDKTDDEFTPSGSRRWSRKRFNQKILNISKVILNAGQYEPPAVVALAEIENRYVLEKLLTGTPLNSFDYKIIHKESPDERGIDVALLYREKLFYPLHYKYIPVISADSMVVKTREILYVSGIAGNSDTIHIFVNHWPSRYSGILESRPLRICAAEILREHVEELYENFINPKIVITGDFNDRSTDRSLSECLRGLTSFDDINSDCLYNLSASWGKESGTIKYRGEWFVFDQIIVSGTLLSGGDGLHTEPDYAKILNLPFLLKKDSRYGGVKTNRTYNGFSYEGGFSDHLPVIIKLESAP